MSKLTDSFAFESITVGVSAVALTTATYDSAVSGRQAWAALISVEADDIRYRVDGTAPTSTVGHLVLEGEKFRIEGDGDLRRFRAIRSAAASGDATLRVTYEE